MLSKTFATTFGVCIALIGGYLALAEQVVHAEDWPQFRGPTTQGTSTEKGLPSEWNAEKNVVWKTALPGGGWSSPSLYNHRLYLTAAVPKGEGSGADEYRLDALCIDAKSGQILWTTDVFEQAADAPKIHSKNSHASPTPIVDGDRVYVHFGHLGTACLDLSGKVIWKNTELKYPPVHGNGGSPALVDGLLIFACDGGSDPFVVALSTADGKEQWRFKRPEGAPKTFAFCTPLVLQQGAKKVAVIPGADSVSALDVETGREVWQVKYEGYSVIPRPVAAHGLVFVSTSYDTPSVLAIRTGGEGDVTDTHIEWSLKKGAPHTPSMLVIGDELYMVSDKGVATCVDAKTGDVHWSERVGGNYSSSLVFADGKIYLQSEEGGGIVLQPGKKFKKLAENGFGERALASYAIGDGAIFIRTEKNLYRVEELSAAAK